MKIKCELYNDSMQEEWRDIPKYEGLYEVSNTGKVRSVTHYSRNNINGGERLVRGRILSAFKMPSGYMQVKLSRNDKREKHYIHRLVACAFLSNDNNLLEVNHIDGNKGNNNVNNLEWVSHKDNLIHAVRMRMTKKANPVLCVETNKQYNSMSEAERDTGINKHFIKTSCDTGIAYKNLHWRRIK